MSFPRWVWAAAPPVFFFALGCLFLRYTGAQYDEVLFASALYPPVSIEYAVNTPFGQLPVMVMTYIGALKSWLYYPLLSLFGPSHALLRLPMLAAGATSVLLFYLTLRRLFPAGIAILVAALLATDVNYLLMSLFDWGPVALAHFFFALALYAGVRFAEDRRLAWLGILGLAAGLALWDKAIFLWLFAGFGGALAVAFPKEILGVVRNRKLAVTAVAALILGSAPLIFYNLVRPLRTLRSEVEVGGGNENYLAKISQIDKTLSGNGLFGYLTRDEPGPRRPAFTLLERASLKADDLLGSPRNNLQRTLITLSFLAFPVLLLSRRRRLVLWAVIGTVLTCLLMFLTQRAGGGLHHIILLWPIPHLLLALAITPVYNRRRAVAVAILAVAVMSNLAMVNAMVAEFARNGSSSAWSDAMRGLIAKVGNRQFRRLLATEWGILEQVRFFSTGRVAFYLGSDGWVSEMANPHVRNAFDRAFERDDALWVGHADGSELTPGINESLVRLAAERGKAKRVLETIFDRHGRPVFEIFEFVKP